MQACVRGAGSGRLVHHGTAHAKALNMEKLIGYHDIHDLPVKQGDTVTIPKGTILRYRHEDKPAGRTYKVKVVSVSPGMTRRERWPDHSAANKEGYVYFYTNPKVTWTGAGGYWTDADINDVLPEGIK